MKTIVKISALGIVLGVASGAAMNAVQAAGFEGAEVTVAAYCCVAPTEPFRFTVPATATVGDGVEFPTGSLVLVGGFSIIRSNVDVGANSIDLRYTQTATASAGSFNGFVFDFAGSGLPAISGVSLNSASSFPAASIGLSFDSDSVFYNAASLAIFDGSRVLIDVTFAPAVPEPSGLLAMAAGGVLTAAWVRRRARSRRRALA